MNPQSDHKLSQFVLSGVLRSNIGGTGSRAMVLMVAGINDVYCLVAATEADDGKYQL
jgi:hypothetical protein